MGRKDRGRWDLLVRSVMKKKPKKGHLTLPEANYRPEGGSAATGSTNTESESQRLSGDLVGTEKQGSGQA